MWVCVSGSGKLWPPCHVQVSIKPDRRTHCRMSPHPAKTHHQTGMRSSVPLRVPRFVIPHPDPILFPLSYLSAFKTKRPHKKSICLPTWVLAVRRAPPHMFVLGKMSVFKVFTEERASFLELWHIWDPWLFSWKVPWGEEVKVWACSVRACWGDYIFRWRRATRPPSTWSFLFYFEILASAFFGGGGFEGVMWPPILPVFLFFFFLGLIAGDLSCLERLGVGWLLWRWQKRIGCPSAWSRGG